MLTLLSTPNFGMRRKSRSLLSVHSARGD
jgi:hypothetical protein